MGSEDGSLLEGIDLSQPCLVWPRLQEAYYRLLAGERETVVRFDGQREVQLQAVNADALKAEIDRLRIACEAAQGRRARFAIRAGWKS